MATTMPRSALFDRSGSPALDWSGLYDEHAPRLHRIVARRVGVEHASDVVQEIFVRAYRNRHSIDPSRPVGAWLSTIALRTSTDALRRRSARPVEAVVDEDHEPALLGGSVDEEFDNVVRREGIKAAFDSLPERQQRVFRHLAIDGWTQEEVAADEGISTEAVKSLFARARHTFKETYQAFAERMGVFGGAAVGGAVWRLRARIQRLQGLVTEHVGAVSAAAATVTVVAIATVPTTRAVPTRADENHVPTSVPVSADAPSPEGEGGDPPEAASSNLPATGSAPESSGGVSTTGPEKATGSGGAAARLGAESSAGREGDGATASVQASASAPPGEQRAGGGVEVYDCSAKPTSTALCIVVDAASLPEGAPPTPG
jgi:RNA polymerase sigma factor (sigma-70 family)